MPGKRIEVASSGVRVGSFGIDWLTLAVFVLVAVQGWEYMLGFLAFLAFSAALSSRLLAVERRHERNRPVCVDSERMALIVSEVASKKGRPRFAEEWPPPAGVCPRYHPCRGWYRCIGTASWKADEVSKVQERRARLAVTDDVAFQEACVDGSVVAAIAASLPEASDTHVDAAAFSGSPMVALGAVNSPNPLTANAEARLAGHEEVNIRRLLARRGDLSDGTMATLAGDTNAGVRAALASNRACPEHIRSFIALSGD